jgi:hypothetical protein
MISALKHNLLLARNARVKTSAHSIGFCASVSFGFVLVRHWPRGGGIRMLPSSSASRCELLIRWLLMNSRS